MSENKTRIVEEMRREIYLDQVLRMACVIASDKGHLSMSPLAIAEKAISIVDAVKRETGRR